MNGYNNDDWLEPPSPDVVSLNTNCEVALPSSLAFVASS